MCFSSLGFYYQATSTTPVFHAKTGHLSWVLNSGANDHMNGKLSIFSSPVVPIHQTICLTDGPTSTTNIRVMFVYLQILLPHLFMYPILHLILCPLVVLQRLSIVLSFSYPIVVFYMTEFRKRFLARDMSAMGCITLGILLVRMC